MTKGISEATDERGVTHHVCGLVRFVRLPKKRRRRNPAKQGYYVTQDGCRWWCTCKQIPANSPATPGKAVDCMSCLVNPPKIPRQASATHSMFIDDTPSGYETQIFNIKTRAAQSITMKRRVGRRR